MDVSLVTRTTRGLLHIVKESISWDTRGYLNLGGAIGKIRKGLSEPLSLDCPAILLIVSSNGKYVSTGMLKKAKQRSTTVNHFESGGTCEKKVFGFRTTRKQGESYLVNNSQVLDKSPSPPIRFPDRTNWHVTRGHVQEMISPWAIRSSTVGMWPCMASGFNGC